MRQLVMRSLCRSSRPARFRSSASSGGERSIQRVEISRGTCMLCSPFPALAGPLGLENPQGACHGGPPTRALITPALFSRPHPPSLTGRRGRKTEQKRVFVLFPSPGEGGWEGSGEGQG